MSEPQSLVVLAVTKCLSLDATTVGMNCGQDFPKKTCAGLCTGCELLLTVSDEKLEAIVAFPQCVDCGTKHRGMGKAPDGRPMCVLCLPAHQSAVNPQQQEDRTARMLLIARLRNHGAGPSNAALAVSQTSTPRRPFINVELFISGRAGKAKAQSVIGNMGYQFDGDDSMEDGVLAYFLKAAAPAWEARHTNSLQLADVRLRLINNGNILCDQDVTVREFIQTHLNVPAAHVVPPSHKAAAKKYGVFPAVIYLELHIQSDLFTVRTGEAVQIGTALSAAKRKLDVESDQSSKRSRTAAPYLSQFKPRTNHTEPPAQTEVQLSMITTSCDVNGKVGLDESTKRSLPSPSFIHDKQLARGTMKLTTPTQLFVVKRFFQVTPEATPVSLSENKNLLTEELLLAGEVKYFLEKFYESGRANDADLDESLAVTDAWLATESFAEGGAPSPAAGLEGVPVDTVRADGITWLVEPLRAGAVQKFSGTLNRRAQMPTSRIAATVEAFIHFVYYGSQQSVVLCDVQTMKSRIEGEQKNVIFDPMAHTPIGKSGPGDHGEEGIKNFIATHKCNAKCESLGLEALQERREEESDSES